MNSLLLYSDKNIVIVHYYYGYKKYSPLCLIGGFYSALYPIVIEESRPISWAAMVSYCRGVSWAVMMSYCQGVSWAVMMS